MPDMLPPSAHANPFDQLARYYDWEHADYDIDVPLYLDFARRSGGPILEIACGSGRLMAPLLELGEQVVGIDSSAPMLERARTFLSGGGTFPRRAALHQADARSFRLKQRFQLAIYGLDSFGLLGGIDDQLAALRSIRDHLEPGGLLIVDVSNGNGRGAEPTDELVLQYDGFDPETGLPLSKWTARSTDHGEQVDHYTYFYDRVGSDGLVRRLVVRLDLRYFGRYELELLLQQAGLVPETFYGSYDLAPFAAGCERLIVVAARPT
ncbi:MAG: class I SAM-dependent methyltransferase [Chloroflexi bacterium]|nr:class I SAM-dependent methyltransferase [Chloroflexota bacterium]